MIAPGTLDVIVLAGDRRASKAVLGESKSFLPLAGAPVLHHVLAAIERARCTGRILVVGDHDRIVRSLADGSSLVRGLRPLVVVPQGQTLNDNVWAALSSALGADAPSSAASGDLSPVARDKLVLLVTGDAPLVLPEEIDELVDAADVSRFDYCLGVTAESTLAAYYPRAGRPGIAMTYWDLRELSWRQTNLHLFRPFRFRNRDYVERVYELRHQRDWRNIARFVGWLWHTGHLSHRTLRAFFALQLARLARAAGALRSPLVRPWLLGRPRFEAVASALAGMRFTIVETHYGGGALDIDDEAAYAAIHANFDEWRAHQARIAALRRRAGTPMRAQAEGIADGSKLAISTH